MNESEDNWTIFRVPQYVPLSPSRHISIEKYDPALHHTIIPQLYAEGFNDDAWPNDWDDIKQFEPDGVLLENLQAITQDLYFISPK